MTRDSHGLPMVRADSSVLKEKRKSGEMDVSIP